MRQKTRGYAYFDSIGSRDKSLYYPIEIISLRSVFLLSGCPTSYHDADPVTLVDTTCARLKMVAYQCYMVAVAQLVERRIVVPVAAGSIPVSHPKV